MHLYSSCVNAIESVSGVSLGLACRQQETIRIWIMVHGGSFCIAVLDRFFCQAVCELVCICVYERKISLVIGIYSCSVLVY